MEFLAPVYLGDTIMAVVEVIAWKPEKQIVTLKTDCFNQDDKQIVTGQAVLMVPREN
jgi:3-hydroxybutyryl-CoA dehydratase